MIASDYGYTPTEFRELTMREVDFMLRKMQVRKHRAYAASAALHGLKVKPPRPERLSASKADPAKAEVASKLMQEAMKRKADQDGSRS